MSDPKEIYLQPECCACPHEGRQWCEDDIGSDWGDPDCDAKAVRYIRADIVEAERDALREKYYDLLYQVQTKHPDESRHETAKRYIHQSQCREITKSALDAGGE